MQLYIFYTEIWYLNVFVLLCTHNTANVNPQLPNIWIVILQVISFDWFMGLVIFGWTDDEAPLNSFPTNFEPKPDEIVCGQFCYCRMAK
jgi:hypothetical protein